MCMGVVSCPSVRGWTGGGGMGVREVGSGGNWGGKWGKGAGKGGGEE